MNRDFPTKTDAGRRWLIKALHPADHSLKAERVPASSRYPTVVQEVISTFDVSCPLSISSTYDTWSIRVITRPDPLVPTEIWAAPGTASSIGPDEWTFLGSVLNQAFWKSSPAFDTHSAEEVYALLKQFYRSCETYRVTSLSTTGNFVGATMTDQGSIVSCQCLDTARTMGIRPAITASSTPFTHPGQLSSLVHLWCDQLPTMSVASMGTNPYVMPAKEGWYAPQKLLCPGHWHKTNNIEQFARAASDTPEDMLLDPFIDTDHSSHQIHMVPYPYFPGGSGTAKWISPCDDGVSVTYVSGIHKTTSFRITLRMCLEMGTIPTSDLAPFSEITAPPDSLAIELYNEIIKSTQDAYPASDNDFGTFFNKVKNIAGKIVKVIEPVANIASGFGVPFAGTVAAMAKGINKAGASYLSSSEAMEEAALLRAESAERAAAKAQKQLAKAKASNSPAYQRLKERAARAAARARVQAKEAEEVFSKTNPAFKKGGKK